MSGQTTWQGPDRNRQISWKGGIPDIVCINGGVGGHTICWWSQNIRIHMRNTDSITLIGGELSQEAELRFLDQFLLPHTHPTSPSGCLYESLLLPNYCCHHRLQLHGYAPGIVSPGRLLDYGSSHRWLDLRVNCDGFLNNPAIPSIQVFPTDKKFTPNAANVLQRVLVNSNIPLDLGPKWTNLFRNSRRKRIGTQYQRKHLDFTLAEKIIKLSGWPSQIGLFMYGIKRFQNRPVPHNGVHSPKSDESGDIWSSSEKSHFEDLMICRICRFEDPKALMN